MKNRRVTIIASIFLLLFAASSYSQTGWFSQPLPVNGQVQDLKFFDANTGLISTINPKYIIRTTNGGYNWEIAYSGGRPAFEFCIIDSVAIYASSTTINQYGLLLRSYNRGLTWDSLPVANSWTVNGISFVNRDTGWIGGTAGGLPLLWLTTNAGLTWTVQSTHTGFGKVFFLKQKVNGEYIGWSMNYSDLWKTTNSGVNWMQIQTSFSTANIYFLNKDTGFASVGSNMKKTTNGGINWVNQPLPSDSTIFTRVISGFTIQGEIIYGTGGSRYLGGTAIYSIIWKTTNFGEKWGYQQPDTSIDRFFEGIDFVNKDTGWSSWIRTNDGGGPIIITGINNQITTKPELFNLEQNYPNPFNSSTRINFSISKPSFISLTIYDITGKEVLKVYSNEFFTSGNFYAGIDIGKMGLSSGVYVYRMRASDIKSNNVFEQSRKFVYVK